MSEEEFIDDVVARLMDKIDRRFPGGTGVTPATVRPLVEQLLEDLERAGIINAIDGSARARVNQALSRIAFAIDGDGDVDGDDDSDEAATRH